MAKDVALFLLRGVVIFLALELVSLPLRTPLVRLLNGLLPQGFEAVWECTALDEVFLFVAFVLAYPGRQSKLPALLLGILVIEGFNALRIWLVIKSGDPLLHDILFRWGGFALVILLFFLSFRWLKAGENQPGP